MFWFALGVMCFAGVIFAIWPFLKANSRNFGLVAGAVVFVVGGSAGLYSAIGSPSIPSAGTGQAEASLDDSIATLAARLEKEPEDVNGWRLLGRSYMQVGNHSAAIAAFERVVELESGESAQGLVDLGQAMLAHSNQAMSPRISSLFENALALEPNNPSALFWGGIAAIERGDRTLAAERWELLLGTNPPPEIRELIELRVAEWRGEAPPPVAQMPPAAPATQPAPPQPGAGAIVAASIGLSAEAAAVLPSEATVFVIARDPAQPVPPIAVTRRRLSELPAVVELGDRESMVPGRELSGFAEFELVARVSLSGTPASRPGDWFGTAIVRPADSGAVSLSIDTEVQ